MNPHIYIVYVYTYKQTHDLQILYAIIHTITRTLALNHVYIDNCTYTFMCINT